MCVYCMCIYLIHSPKINHTRYTYPHMVSGISVILRNTMYLDWNAE